MMLTKEALVLAAFVSSRKHAAVRPCIQCSSGVDEPERSGTPFRYLSFSKNARSGTYCQVTRNAFYLPFRHLFTMSRDDYYEFMTPRCFTYLQPVGQSYTLDSDVVDIWRKQKFRTVATRSNPCYFTK